MAASSSLSSWYLALSAALSPALASRFELLLFEAASYPCCLPFPFRSLPRSGEVSLASAAFKCSPEREGEAERLPLAEGPRVCSELPLGVLLLLGEKKMVSSSCRLSCSELERCILYRGLM